MMVCEWWSLSERMLYCREYAGGGWPLSNDQGLKICHTANNLMRRWLSVCTLHNIYYIYYGRVPNNKYYYKHYAFL